MSEASTAETAGPVRGPLTWSRGRTVLVVLVVGAVAAAVLVVPALWLSVTLLGRSAPGVDADGSIDGVETFEGLSNRHVDPPADYDVLPPVGGDHLGVWQDCGFYDRAILAEAGVHSLEHGAVWVTYDPDLPQEQVAQLRRLAEENAYLLVSPMRGLPSPLVASAWGRQLQLRTTDDERLEAFLVRYQQGPQNPEPGAPCSGGLSEPAPQQPQV